MELQEARTVVLMLLKFYPHHKLDDEGVELYAQAWTPIRKETAMRTANSWVSREKFFPTVAEFNILAKQSNPEREVYRLRLPPHSESPEVLRQMAREVADKLDLKITETQRALDKCSCTEPGRCPVP